VQEEWSCSEYGCRECEIMKLMTQSLTRPAFRPQLIRDVAKQMPTSWTWWIQCMRNDGTITLTNGYKQRYTDFYFACARRAW
jgi:hypothetical protein